MTSGFWKGKNVLITGFEGFVGSHLTKVLLKTKARIVGLDIKTFRKETILTKEDYRKFIVYKGSVTNLKLLKEIFKKHLINIIFHLAAEAIVERSYRNPRRAFETNIKGTWQVLEAARQKRGFEAIIIASSDKAYGEHKKIPYTEDVPLVANHPYDVSKSCADLIASTYAHTYNLPVVVTRCGNIYGPGDFNFSRIVPDAFRSIILEQTLKVRSDGNFVRDYVYIEDIINGYTKIAELVRIKNLNGEAFNFSNEEPISVLALIDKIGNTGIIKKELRYKIMDIAKAEIKKQFLSSAKAKRILNWQAKYSLEEGLKKTAAWYLNYFRSNGDIFFRD